MYATHLSHEASMTITFATLMRNDTRQAPKLCGVQYASGHCKMAGNSVVCSTHPRTPAETPYARPKSAETQKVARTIARYVLS